MSRSAGEFRHCMNSAGSKRVSLVVRARSAAAWAGRTDDLLLGVFIDDRRNPNEDATFLAEQGEMVQNDTGTFLILANGSVQRREASQRDPNIVLFDRYAFDLSRFTGRQQAIIYGVRERYLWDLADPDPNDPLIKYQPGQVFAELHDRITAPLYPIAFVAIAFAVLGAPRTTRQSRGFSMGVAIVSISALRMIGFASAVFAVQLPAAVIGMYASIALGIILSLITIARGATIEPPALVVNAMNALIERASRFAPA